MNKLKVYNSTYWSLVSFPDNLLSGSRNKRINIRCYERYSRDELERISLSRTKRRIKEICLCNDFEYFFTCTVNNDFCDRFSLDDTQLKMKKICKQIKRKFPDFKYIFITEKHKDGAFHFHGLCKKLELYKNDFGYYSNIQFDSLGFNSFSPIRSYNRVCNYITKYITKECVKNSHNQIYFCSRGLKKPEEFFMMSTDLKSIFPRVYENDYCQKVDFDVSSTNIITLQKLYNYFTNSNDFLHNYNFYFTNVLHLLTNCNFNIIN